MKQNKLRANIVLFFALLILLPLATLLIPKKEFSENENRFLETFPLPTLKTVADKSFMNHAETYLSDHFALREQWIQLKNQLDILSNKKEINNVYLTKKRLIEHQTAKATDPLWQSNIDAMHSFVSKYSLPSYLMVVPTAEGVYFDQLPKYAPYVNQKEVIDQIHKRIPAKSGLTPIDVYTSLLAAKNQYIFYKTDHHWTSLGAYLGYFSSSKALNFSQVDLDSFNIEHASHDFKGTLYSKTLYDKCGADVIDLYHLTTSDPQTMVTVKSGSKVKEYNSIFFREYLDKKDKYAVFLGQNEPYVTVKTSVSNGKKLLIFKDSYAHSMVQFYMHHYEEITLVDLRYLSNLEQYVNIYDYSQILFVYNFESIMTDANIGKLAHF